VSALLAVDDAPHAGVMVSFVADDGEHSGPLSQLWAARFERVAPVRPVQAFRGQRNFAGAWWLASTGTHVGFESWLERDHLMGLDFDPSVVGVASQPFWLSWSSAGRPRRHAPDYFARLRDGTGVVVDVRPDDRIEPSDVEAFTVTAQACESVGWQYRRVGVIDAVWAANLRWLAGYRHPRCFDPDRVAQLREALGAPLPLSEAVRLVGDRLAVLPVLFHLLWTGVLMADLRSAPLTGHTVVGIAGGGVAATGVDRRRTGAVPGVAVDGDLDGRRRDRLGRCRGRAAGGAGRGPVRG